MKSIFLSITAILLLIDIGDSSAQEFSEAFGLDLYNSDENKIRLGLYSNESGDKSSLGVDYNFSKGWELKKTYPNEGEGRFLKMSHNPPTKAELLDIAAKNYSNFSDQRIEELFQNINHSVDDFTAYNIKLSAEGFIAMKPENNLKNFNKVRAEGSYSEWHENQVTYGGGLFTAYETDQKNEESQFVYGLTAWGSYWFQQGNANEYAFLKVEYGEVDPSDDSARVELLEGDNETYYRWEGNATVQLNLSIDEIDKLELSYRYFYEPAAPMLIQQAGKDQFSLFTASLIFINGWFVAFSDGQLPFNEESEHMYEIGWSYNFK